MRNRVIWRYMDLAKYIGLLDRGLFFALPSAFGDPWEGSWALQDVNAFREKHFGVPVEEVTQLWNEEYASKAAALNVYGVSCWHVSDVESAALWSAYVPHGLGIAVQSTLLDVERALRPAERDLLTSSVRYIDYTKELLGNDPVQLLSHKRIEFEHESEVRFLVRLRDEERQAMALKIQVEQFPRSRHVSARAFEPLITGHDIMASPDRNVVRRAAPNGIYLETHVDQLINKVHLAPGTPWHVRQAVVAATKAFGFPADLVTEPQIDLAPFDELKFHDPKS